jgi:DNA ligase 1
MNNLGSSAGFESVATVEKMIVERFPRLYKKASSGAIQYWDIFAQAKNIPTDEAGTFIVGAEIVTMYGQLGTPNPQRTADLIKEGKNPGKKNATTAFQQATKEAKSKWEKQKKNKGYVETEAAARAEEIDTNLIEGGLFPMLAEKYRDHAKKVAWPVYVQPKLNGHRCIAIVRNGKATLWSRKRKSITSMPHIIAQLEANFTDVTLDGELYNQEIGQTSPDYVGEKSAYAMTLQELSSLVRSQEPKDRFERVQYHIYDLVSDKKFVDRYDELQSLFSTVDLGILRLVQTGMVENDEMVQVMMNDVRAGGFEGLILRNAEGLYLQSPTKRSYDLLKVKKFVDEEFEIVGIEEGRGKLQGHAIFVCKAANGNKFTAKLRGETKFLKACFEDHSLWKGKLLTVEYSELTPDEQVPFQGVGVDLRDREG